MQERSHTTNNVEIGDRKSRHVGQWSLNSRYLKFLFGMAVLTTDLHSVLRARKSRKTVAFSRAAETVQTGKPVLLRCCRSDCHLL